MSYQAKIKRYTLIIEKISSISFPSANAILEFLHDQGFEISKRTIERDLENIRNEFGLEITYDNRKDGYFIDYENSVDESSFFRFLEIVNTAQLLTDSLKESKETLDYISFDKGGGLKGIDLLKPLLQAIKEHRKIKFRHFSYQREQWKTYSMKPYLLKEYHNRWYVVGVISGMNQVRSIGLDRIENLEIKTDTFEPDSTINPKDNFNAAIGVMYHEGQRERVLLSFTPDQGHYIKSLPLHDSQKVIKDDETECLIELYIVPNFELKQVLLSHADQVKVIEPLKLAEKVKADLRKALNQY